MMELQPWRSPRTSSFPARKPFSVFSHPSHVTSQLYYLPFHLAVFGVEVHRDLRSLGVGSSVVISVLP